MGCRLLVEYEGVPGLLRDWDEQLKVGGFFAPIDPPAGLPPFADGEIILAIDDVDPIVARSRVTVANPGAVCFEILPISRAGLKAAVERLAPVAAQAAPPAQVTPAPAPAAQATPAPAAPVAGADEGTVGKRRSVRFVGPYFKVDTRARSREKADGTELPPEGSVARKIAGMNLAQKVQLAVHCEIDARAFLARERSSGVQLALLKNPKLTLEEVMAIARAPALHPEAALSIAHNRVWGNSPQIALMLVRNPRVPTALAIGMVAKLSLPDARMIAKSTDIRLPISAAARKRVID